MYCYHCMNKLEEDNLFCDNCGKPVKPEDIPHHLKPGTLLHRKYMVGCSLGEGGFGITYIGLDLTLDMKVAVKEFYPGGYANRDHNITNNVTLNYKNEGEYFKSGREQFLREAKSLAKFTNEEGIVDVRDFFTENDTAYIIMEYLEGETLADKLRKSGTMEAQNVFSLMLPVMRSLEKMHAEGIIHRDISPDNIMFTNDGYVKLMDFGSARYFTEAEKKTMSVMLKPGYAPYEQYSSQGNQGPWTDVYGLCATMYRCITGKEPTDSLSRYQKDTLQKPSQLGISIPPELESALMNGLAVLPERRCQSMQQLISLTESALSVKTVAGKPDDDEYRTQAADGYRTAYANHSYGDHSYGDRAYGSYSYNGRTYNDRSRDDSRMVRQNAAANPPAQKQKSYVPVIAVCIAATLLILGGLIIFLRLNGGTESLFKRPSSSASSKKTVVAETVIVPDVSGKKLSDAQQQLEEMGLIVETKEEENEEIAAGYVIRQSVEGGRELNSGDTVMLYVAKEPTANGSGNDSGQTVSTPSPQVSDSQGVLYNTLCKEFVTLRSQPSMGASEITRISKGEAVEYIGDVYDSTFIQVSYNGQTGYVLSAFFTPEDTANGRYVMYCGARQYANLRSQPGSDNSNNIDTIPTNDPVQCTGSYDYVGNQKYLEVRYKNRTGYVLAEVMNYEQKGSTYKGN